MRVLILIILVIYMSACVPPEMSAPQNQYIATHPEIVVLDDSKSAGSKTWVQQSGFTQRSIAGLQSWQVDSFPTVAPIQKLVPDEEKEGQYKVITVGYAPVEVIFWGVGYVDAINAFSDWQYTVDRYEAQVQYLFSQTDAEIICLYADIKPYLILEAHIKAWEGIQAVMQRECPTIIIYDNWGYHHSSSDGVHGTKEDNNRMGIKAIEWYKSRKVE